MRVDLNTPNPSEFLQSREERWTRTPEFNKDRDWEQQIAADDDRKIRN